MKKVFSGAICISPLILACLIPGIGVLASLAIVVLALLFVKESRDGTLSFIHLNLRRSVATGILVGAIFQCALVFAIEPAIESLTKSEINLENFEAVTGNFTNYVILLAAGLIFGGIIEELIFRGFVIGWGSQIFGERSGVILACLSAAAFGVAHLYQGIPGVITTGLIGFVLGVVYLLLGRKLLPVVVAHMTINFIGITQIYFGYS